MEARVKGEVGGGEGGAWAWGGCVRERRLNGGRRRKDEGGGAGEAEEVRVRVRVRVSEEGRGERGATARPGYWQA